MQFANYLSASIISFSGLLIGAMLVNIAPEEQKPLRKYFDLSRKISLLAIFVFAAFYYINDYFNLLALLGYFLFLLLIEFKISDLLKRSIITYCVLGILFFLSSKNTNLFTLESSMVLLNGLFTAPLIYNKKDGHSILFYNLGFVIIANLLFFL